MAKVKKNKVVDLSSQPDMTVETVIKVKGNEVKVVKQDYRGTQYLNRHE